ncbi:hypothetical protein [Neisseria weixii]|nr:hypothetical protein [Neisseria weixii]
MAVAQVIRQSGNALRGVLAELLYYLPLYIQLFLNPVFIKRIVQTA